MVDVCILLSALLLLLFQVVFFALFVVAHIIASGGLHRIIYNPTQSFWWTLHISAHAIFGCYCWQYTCTIYCPLHKMQHISHLFIYSLLLLSVPTQGQLQPPQGCGNSCTGALHQPNCRCFDRVSALDLVTVSLLCELHKAKSRAEHGSFLFLIIWHLH